eukprot:402972-Alexandrium_andersonii.AAC.1
MPLWHKIDLWAAEKPPWRCQECGWYRPVANCMWDFDVASVPNQTKAFGASAANAKTGNRC